MSLHDKIMNISASTVNASLAGYTDELKAYKAGHRDARHEAAEMALSAERQLVQALELLAVSDAIDPVAFAQSVLVELGYWDAL